MFLAVAVVVIAGLVALWTLGGGGGDVATGPGNPVQSTRQEALSPAEPLGEDAAPPSAIAADYTLREGERAILIAAEFPTDRPVTLGLTLPVPLTSSTPLKAKIVDGNGRELDALAMVQGEERRSANLDIEAGWLSPGDYLIHLITTERTHLPLRRYPLEVR